MLPAQLGTGGNNTPFVVANKPVACCMGNGQLNQISMAEQSLRTSHPPGLMVRYIVRRLTPTECARLQGFADAWGHPDRKDSLTEDEYRFWLTVRNTHAAINGKAVRDYTPEQMLRWYNKLHTDSAEYKMWGDGIALPCARYVMEGVAQYV